VLTIQAEEDRRESKGLRRLLVGSRACQIRSGQKVVGQPTSVKKSFFRLPKVDPGIINDDLPRSGSLQFLDQSMVF
jgi:hypothetical protein